MKARAGKPGSVPWFLFAVLAAMSVGPVTAQRDLAYVGALGPAHRRQWLLEEVAAEDADLKEELTSRLRGPLELDLGDRSAAGIAVAVVQR
jgi:hypothetical protein